MKSLQKIFLIILVIAVGVRILLSVLFHPVLRDGQQLHFTTTLLTEPTQKGNYQTVTVQYGNGVGTIPLVLVLPTDIELHYGQTIIINGTLKVKALDKNRQMYAFSPSQISVKMQQNTFLVVAYTLRKNIQKLYESILPEKSAALLLGIVLGVKGNFPQNFLKDLQATGVMHVIAASGMNVTMVAGFLLGLFALFLKRQWAIVFTVSGLLFYCLLSGMQPSILRATIMIGFAFSAQLLGRQYAGLYGLLLAGLGMLLYNPAWVSDIGFQLSFAATVGIFFLKPLLPKFFGDDIGTTIAAQIATLPILVGAFGSYGLLSIPVNAFVLWTIPFLMILGGVGGLVGLVFPLFGQMIVWLCAPLLWYFESVVGYFGNLGWNITILQLPVVLVLGYYLLLGSVILVFYHKRG